MRTKHEKLVALEVEDSQAMLVVETTDNRGRTDRETRGPYPFFARKLKRDRWGDGGRARTVREEVEAFRSGKREDWEPARDVVDPLVIRAESPRRLGQLPTRDQRKAIKEAPAVDAIYHDEVAGRLYDSETEAREALRAERDLTGNGEIPGAPYDGEYAVYPELLGQDRDAVWRVEPVADAAEAGAVRRDANARVLVLRALGVLRERNRDGRALSPEERADVRQYLRTALVRLGGEEE
jgi:hypothetical protein